MDQTVELSMANLLLAIGILLLSSRVLSEFLKRFGLPILIGEILVGIFMGPTVMGKWFPEFIHLVFPSAGPVAIALEGIFKLSIVLLLFVAGMEVQLPVALRQGRLALFTSLTSMIVPFTLGFWTGWHFPEWFQARVASPLVFALFFGTAMSISALPVIARILLDLGIYRTRIGMLIIASAMFNDLLGWLVFSVVLALLKNNGVGTGLLWTVTLVLGYGFFMLTIGRRLLSRLVPWMQEKLSWPGGLLGVSLGLCFLSAALTEFLGIHAILGAFIFGIALGDCAQLHEKAREIIHQFITNFFAPLFFVSIGLYVNIIDLFDLRLVLLVLFLATAGKLVGAITGAFMGGLDWRNSLAVGVGMNARGAMEIVLSTLAYRAGIISQPLYVALILMALITSLVAGPLMRRILNIPSGR